MNPHEIKSMDDLRSVMNSPEVQAANAELSKRFLKNNRPKSLVVVALFVAAFLLAMAVSGHKASSVTPASLRTARSVTVSWAGAGLPDSPATLTAAQRDGLLDLLGQVKVKRVAGTIDAAQPEGSCVFTAGEDQFTITSAGYLLTDGNPYCFLSPGSEEVWQQLTALLEA